MEFTKLSEVEVVETANDTDKVLIEQNGEIKRVPKTEVGGGGGNVLIITGDPATETFSANMTLAEALDAFNKQELGIVVLTVEQEGMKVRYSLDMMADYSPMLGADCLVMVNMMMELQLCWTADGISTEMPAAMSN